MAERILILMVGFPYSGKTTWAKASNCPILSPDAIRLALGHRYHQPVEPLVWAYAGLMVRALFLSGNDQVIVDATNNTRKRRDHWRALLEGELAVKVVCKHMMASEAVCLERARDHGDELIIPVIERMAAEHEPLSNDEQIY